MFDIVLKLELKIDAYISLASKKGRVLIFLRFECHSIGKLQFRGTLFS